MSDDEPQDERFQPYSLGDILQIERRQRSEPWPPHEGLEAVEHGFREGYYQGWRAATEAAADRLDENADENGWRVVHALRRHLSRKLSVWVHEQRSKARVHGHHLFTSAHKDVPYELGGDWPPAMTPSDEEASGAELARNPSPPLEPLPVWPTPGDMQATQGMQGNKQGVADVAALWEAQLEEWRRDDEQYSQKNDQKRGE